MTSTVITVAVIVVAVILVALFCWFCFVSWLAIRLMFKETDRNMRGFDQKMSRVKTFRPLS